MAARHDPPAPAPVHAHPVARSRAEREPEPVVAPEPAPPAHEPHPAPEEPAVEPTPHGSIAAASAAAEPVAALADQATVSAREAPAASAVIGRYESEGTSYVMYADGSIDAQSEAGVYRFASMAELKTFIES